MKELTIEQKSQRYDEALGRAKEMRTTLSDKAISEYIFPELKENEDERIRKAIVKYFTSSITNPDYEIYGIPFKKVLSWLEKQGEQKLAWSEEDEMFVHGLIRGLTAKRDIHGHTTFSSDCIDITETINWLKSLKDRVQPRNQWKPSKEQMKALWNVYQGGKEQAELATLYNDLKKLREE